LIPGRQILRSWLQSAGFLNQWQIPRGSDSPGMWRESLRLHRREHGSLPRHSGLFRLALYAILLAIPRLSEETILVARKGQ
jgi:hypothetical protein